MDDLGPVGSSGGERWQRSPQDPFRSPADQWASISASPRKYYLSEFLGTWMAFAEPEPLKSGRLSFECLRLGEAILKFKRHIRGWSFSIPDPSLTRRAETIPKLEYFLPCSCAF
jgi:hypothetical protein